MAIDFPNSPTNGQTFTVGDTTWTYDGSKWNKNAVTIAGPTGPNPLVIQPGTPSATNVLWLDTDAVSTNPSVPSSVVDNKGELLVGTAADTVGVVTRSTTNGDMLVVDTSTTSGLRWQGQTNTGRNLLINGAMQVAQRGTSATGIAANGYYTADRWQTNIAGLGTWTQTVEADGPSGSGFGKSIKMLCTTADASPDAGDFLQVAQRLEGQDVQRLLKGTSAAQQVSLSFWVKSNVTGTYIAELQDVDHTRLVSASYTISSSATWEKKTITFPADTTGILDNDSNDSFRTNFWLGAGTTYSSGTLGTTWASVTQANRAVGQTNLAAATNNYWQVTGVQLEVGPVATGFDFEPYERTLAKCQRYYYLHVSGTTKTICTGNNFSATSANGQVFFPVTMRTAPTLTATSGTDYYAFARNGADDLFNSLTIERAGENAATVGNAAQISGTGGQAGYFLTNNASASVAFGAEL